MNKGLAMIGKHAFCCGGLVSINSHRSWRSATTGVLLVFLLYESCSNSGHKIQYELSTSRNIEISQAKKLYLIKDKTNEHHGNYKYRCKFYNDSLLKDISFFYVFYEGSRGDIIPDKSKYISASIDYYNAIFNKSSILKSMDTNIGINNADYIIAQLNDNTTIAFTIRDSLPENYYFFNRDKKTTIEYMEGIAIINK